MKLFTIKNISFHSKCYCWWSKNAPLISLAISTIFFFILNWNKKCFKNFKQVNTAPEVLYLLGHKIFYEVIMIRDEIRTQFIRTSKAKRQRRWHRKMQNGISYAIEDKKKCRKRNVHLTKHLVFCINITNINCMSCSTMGLFCKNIHGWDTFWV